MIFFLFVDKPNTTTIVWEIYIRLHIWYQLSKTIYLTNYCYKYHWNKLDIAGCANAQHYNDVIISAMASQITSLTIVYPAVYWGADQRKHQSSASLAFLRGVHRWPVNSPHKGPVTRKMFPFDDVIMVMKWSKRYTYHDIGLAFPIGHDCQQVLV